MRILCIYFLGKRLGVSNNQLTPFDQNLLMSFKILRLFYFNLKTIELINKMEDDGYCLIIDSKILA